MTSELELHVGPLTAVFAPDVRRAAAEAGQPVPSHAAVRERIESWRAWIGDGLIGSGHMTGELVWDEAAAAAVARVRVSLDAVRALKLLLVYGDLELAPRDLPPHPDRDPEWSRAAANGFAETAFDQILVPELWIPAPLSFTFTCPLPDGHEVQAGSVDTLADQLDSMRGTVLAGTPFDAALAAADGSQTRDLRALAQRAAAALEAAAGQARRSRLPILWQAVDG